jgi:anti-anti-sigma factor
VEGIGREVGSVGGQHALTSEVSTTPEVHVHQTLVSDSISAPQRALPIFECTLSDGAVDAACVRVSGELDIATAPQLDQMLREAEHHARLIVLDLRELGFTDCSGVRVIVDASIRARQGGRRLVLLRGGRHVNRVFTLTRASEVVEIVDAAPGAPAIEALPRLDQAVLAS